MKGLNMAYDNQADVLYISLGNPRKAITTEMGEGNLIRKNPKTKEIIGITIIDFKSKAKEALSWQL